MVWATGGFHGVLLQLEADQWAVILVLLAAGLALKAVILWWLYRDITARGRDPRGWLIAAFFLDLPTLIVWLVVRAQDDGPPTGPNGSPSTQRDEAHTHGGARDDEQDADNVPLGPRTFEEPDEPKPPLTHVTPADTPSTGERILVTCPYCSTQFTTRTSPAGPTTVTCPACAEQGVVPDRKERT